MFNIKMNRLYEVESKKPDKTYQQEAEGGSFTDYSAPLFIAWQLNSACNLACLHCCEEAGHSMPDELTTDEIMRFCGEIVESGVPYVAISGGEPMLHPDFFTICEFLRKHNVSLKVETNGHLIDSDTADRFAQLGFRSVQISVDGSTAATFETLRVGGDWQKTVAACKSLVKAGVNTEIVFVPTNFNIHETADVIDLAHRTGVYGFYTGKLMRIGRAAKNWNVLCPSEQQYAQFFDVLKAKQAEYDGVMKIYYYPYDVMEELKYRLSSPSASLLVIPDGRVKLIGPLPFICGNVRKHTLALVWERYKRAWRNARVVTFARGVISDPNRVQEANKWIELYTD